MLIACAESKYFIFYYFRRSRNASLGKCKFLELVVVVAQRARRSSDSFGTVIAYNLRGIDVRINRFNFQSSASGTLSYTADNESVTCPVLLHEMFAGTGFTLRLE